MIKITKKLLIEKIQILTTKIDNLGNAKYRKLHVSVNMVSSGTTISIKVITFT